MPKNTKAVILAAGLGTRMKSGIPKVLHNLRGKPLIKYVLDSVRASGIDDIICVLGDKSDMAKDYLKDVGVVRQKRPLGSADALSAAKSLFKNFLGDILVLCGDTPLIKPATLKKVINRHKRKKNFCTLLSARMADPSGYGRIVRDGNGGVVKIVEEAEASRFEKAIQEVNVGVYCFKQKGLSSLLSEVKKNNKKNEYFLTDTIMRMRKKNLKVDSARTDDSDEALGINSRKDLSIAEKILQKRAAARLIDKGVTIVAPESTYIDEDADIGRDTVIYPHTIIEGRVKIGSNCSIGPFTRIRPGCELKDGVEIGNFVELVRTKIDKDTKVKHKTYLGDAVIGKNVNIGAGAITANYDGKSKYVTKIDDNAFIGSGTILIAPVKVGKHAATGAGAVVTKNHDVPPKAVAVGVPARIIKNK